MKTLLHVCCAPCSIQCIEVLQNEGIEPVAFWYNPNIHPFVEYTSRKTALLDHAARTGLAIVVRDEYGLRPFVKGVISDLENRCDFCYRTRMDATAEYALKNGYDSFTTTLLISPYQKHEAIVHAAEQAAQRCGVTFIYRDFRPYFRIGQQQARSLGLYMQKYCGCIFSEEDRYAAAGARTNQSGTTAGP